MAELLMMGLLELLLLLLQLRRRRRGFTNSRVGQGPNLRFRRWNGDSGFALVVLYVIIGPGHPVKARYVAMEMSVHGIVICK